MNELALFAGAGGGILGGHLLGWRTVCAVERDAYAAQVLAQRQNDGILKAFPIWSDVTTFDGKPWRGVVDVISAGITCQPHSMAGKREGTDDKRWLWPNVARIISEVEPSFVWVENVEGFISSGGLEQVLADLACLGFDAEWGLLSAAALGYDHERARVWILAYPSGLGLERESLASNSQKASFSVNTRCETSGGNDEAWIIAWRKTQPRIQRVADGLAFVMDRHRAIGNGQVPRVAARAFTILAQRAGIEV